MKTIELIQGSPEWHAHRATHFNASDAPAMMGCSKYKTRTQLLHELKTGIAPEVDAAKQRRFDAGHRFEELARHLAVKIVGEPLYPSVGTEGELSASFDGLTMAEDIAFEHKTLNNELRAAITDEAAGQLLPLQYRVQMEQQCMVAGCDKVLFMASKWADEELVEERHCWYLADMDLRAQIVAGWAQFAQDLAAYVPPAPAAPALVASPVQALPVATVQIAGEISIRDNLGAVEVAVHDFLDHKLIRKPETDQDFADLDLQIKEMKAAEESLESGEKQTLAQIQPVQAWKQRKDLIAKLLRDNRLMAEKLLASEKERRRGEIVAAGVSALREHVEALNHKMRPTFSRVGVSYMPTIPADFGAAIKGKRSLSSMEEAVDHELARAKVAANEVASRIQLNLATLREHAAELAFLFPDTAQIALKAPDDLTTLVKARIAEHQAKEQARIEADRERIRAEEQAKAEAQARAAELERQRAAEEAARRNREEEERAAAPAAVAATAAAPASAPAPVAHALAPAPVLEVVSAAPAANDPAPVGPPTLRIGDIAARLGWSMTAEQLRGLGIEPAARERGATLYHEHQFSAICAAVARRANEAAAAHTQRLAA